MPHFRPGPRSGDSSHAWVRNEWYRERIQPDCTDAGVRTHNLEKYCRYNKGIIQCLCYCISKCWVSRETTHFSSQEYCIAPDNNSVSSSCMINQTINQTIILLRCFYLSSLPRRSAWSLVLLQFNYSAQSATVHFPFLHSINTTWRLLFKCAHELIHTIWRSRLQLFNCVIRLWFLIGQKRQTWKRREVFESIWRHGHDWISFIHLLSLW